MSGSNISPDKERDSHPRTFYYSSLSGTRIFSSQFSLLGDKIRWRAVAQLECKR